MRILGSGKARLDLMSDRKSTMYVFQSKLESILDDGSEDPINLKGRVASECLTGLTPFFAFINLRRVAQRSSTRIRYCRIRFYRPCATRRSATDKCVRF